MPFSGTGILREIYNNSRNAKKIARGFFSLVVYITDTCIQKYTNSHPCLIQKTFSIFWRNFLPLIISTDLTPVTSSLQFSG